jgi:FKBP-type peptidyl-prolyl cis-trans isomerase
MEKYGGDGEPFSTRGGVGELIPGWDMTVPGMRVGEVRWLFVPSLFGYGERGNPPRIPPNADLKFEFEIVSKR